jgi:5,10-methylenetetrahydromethanopterin reductase
MVAGSVNLIPESPIGDIVALAQQADALGFARCWVYDEGLATRDVYITLAAIAATTEQIALGPGITNPYTRHPAQTAAAIASLDEMSGGRAFLGMGPGGSLTLDPLAIERRRPLGAVEEAIAAARGLFGGEPVDRDGEHVVLRSAQLDYARPDIEIWLAGRGPRILGLGGAVADGVMLDFLHAETIADAVGLVRAGAESAGRPTRIAYSTAIVTSADDLEFVRPHMTYRLVDAPPAAKELIGLSSADSERIREALSGGLHAAAEHVRDEWVYPFVIAGSDAECAAELGTLMERHGIEEFVLPMFEMAEPAVYLDRVAAVLAAA